jgi:GntR family transcriptional regulator, transcriptional repressor for pyruvate dehydrogenase complex
MELPSKARHPMNGAKRLGSAAVRKGPVPERLTDVAIARVKEMITSGKLVPGQRLPREQDLAREFGLSRNSLREAVRALTLIKVLETRQGDGTYVTSLEPRLLFDAVAFVTNLLRDHQMLEVWEVRRLLEPAATALAAARMTEEDHRQLAECIERFRVATTADDVMLADVEFHRCIYRCARNSVLESVLETLSLQTLQVRAWRKATDEQHRRAALEEHSQIYRAILARDPELARAASAMHVAEGESWLRDSTAPKTP